MPDQVVTAEHAATLVHDGDTVALAANGGGMLEPDAVISALEQRFLSTASPRELRVVHALGVGDRGRRGLNGFAHEGMTTRVIGGHWTWSPRMMDLASEEKLVELLTLDGSEHLRSRPLHVNVAIIRDTGVDEHGNVGADAEPAVLDVLEAAEAVATSKRWLNRELHTDGLAASEAALEELSDETLQGGEFEERMEAFYTAKKARQAQRAAQ